MARYLRKTFQVKNLVAVAALLLSSHALADSGLSCKILKESERRLDLKVGARQISVVGWDHIPAITGYLYSVGNAINHAAMNFEEKGDCEWAALILKEPLRNLSADVQASQVTQDVLNEIQHAAKIETLGVEYSPEESRESLETIEHALAPLKGLDQKCHSEPGLLGSISQIQSLFRGPWGVFSRSFDPPIPIVGMESFDLRQKAAPVNAELRTALAEIGQSFFTEAIGKRIMSMGAAKESGLDVSQAQIDGVVVEAAPNDEPTAKKVRRFVTAYLQERELVHLRDQFIVDALLKTPGNVTLIIGWGHSGDLARQLKARAGCD
jgi:hypothetical protein